MADEQRERVIAGLWNVLKSPAIIVPAASVWAYCLVVVFTDSYLSYFGIPFSMFNPSLPRLFAFGLVPLVIAASVAGMMFWASGVFNTPLSSSATPPRLAIYTWIVISESIVIMNAASLSFSPIATSASITASIISKSLAVLILVVAATFAPSSWPKIKTIEEELEAKITRIASLIHTEPKNSDARVAAKRIIHEKNNELLSIYRVGIVVIIAVYVVFFATWMSPIWAWYRWSRGSSFSTPSGQAKVIFSDESRAAMVLETPGFNRVIIQNLPAELKSGPWYLPTDTGK